MKSLKYMLMETLRSKWRHLLKSFLELGKVKIRGKCPKSKAAPCNIAISTQSGGGCKVLPSP